MLYRWKNEDLIRIIRVLEDSIDQWRIVFEVSGIIAMVTYMFYQWFGTAQIQSWNIQQPIRNQLQETEKMFSKENGATQLITKAK
ncbi:uncharacterized protein Dvir_GJ26706, isoform A [Drosophila virilis]|uniref:Uncharacterized protein, isoform A n=1 Tax=Drosophila virilis TaxID=7244 RepID=A0A0Q9WBK5_DROVI|nr:uncharacterized protein Dvir_GJ26706, isoform A [Drosophila virilis]